MRSRPRAKREREREREREEEEIAHCRRPRDFAPRTQITVRLRLQIAPFDFTNKPRGQDRTPSTSLRWHRDGIDRTKFWLGFDIFDRVWWIFFGWVLMNLSGSDEFFFGWVLMNLIRSDEFFLVGFWWIWPDLCLSIEKLYYIFVWELRKCKKQ